MSSLHWNFSSEPIDFLVEIADTIPANNGTRPMNYHEYMASRSWRRNPTRLAELEAAGFRCRVCNHDGSHNPIEVHHRTYENLGREQPGDLTALCRNCHRVVTDHLRRLRYTQWVPAHANIRPALQSPSPLFDFTFKETS
ncbi:MULTISPECIES: hypothetical protein [unclassified Bradyrhizobium]|uniref:hypothetical protein n=1 Tax=unclassified Bradyrhizobium TaxID=2631580 RepID=UPI0033959EBD